MRHKNEENPPKGPERKIQIPYSKVKKNTKLNERKATTRRKIKDK